MQKNRPESLCRKLITRSSIYSLLVLEKIDPDIQGMLLPGEQVIFIASQSKVAPGGALYPNSLYITNMRMLFKGLGWLGLRAEIVNINYNDISTIKLKCGIFTTELYFKFRSSDYTLKLPALEKGAAQRASQLVQRGIRGELPGQGQMVMVPEKQVNGDEPATATTAAASEHLEKRESNLMITPLPLSPPCAINTTSCRYCNYSLQQAANFCPECGKSVKIETNILKVCPNCDSVTSYNAVFCSTCHQKFPDNLVQ